MRPDHSLESRNNNISLLRLAAALMVILSHAWPLTGNATDWIGERNGNQITLGGLAVTVFFFFGGFLIMKSVAKRAGFKKYILARCRRIFPALWITVLLTVLCLGPLMTVLPLQDYFLHSGTLKYLLNGLLIPVHELPGVFETNPYGPTVNGSLWTLPVEFICYLFCYLFFALGLSGKKESLFSAAAVIVVSVLASRFVPQGIYIIHSAIRPALFFLIGMLCYLFRDRIPGSPLLFWGAVILLVLSVVFGFAAAACYAAVPVILLRLAFGKPLRVSAFLNRHEISYGVYLTAFPVQQVIARFLPDLSPVLHFLVALPFAVLAGILVTGIEKAVMKKRRA